MHKGSFFVANVFKDQITYKGARFQVLDFLPLEVKVFQRKGASSLVFSSLKVDLALIYSIEPFGSYCKHTVNFGSEIV